MCDTVPPLAYLWAKARDKSAKPIMLWHSPGISTKYPFLTQDRSQCCWHGGSFHGTAASCSPADTEMNQARAHLCLATRTSVFEGTAALLLSFVFLDLSGNIPDFSRAEPDVSQWGRVELGFVHTWRAKPVLTDTLREGMFG